MAQGPCSLLGAMDKPSFSSQMQANATPTSADACLSIVHSLMCHRQVRQFIALQLYCCSSRCNLGEISVSNVILSEQSTSVCHNLAFGYQNV